MASPMMRQRSSTVRAAAFRGNGFSFENAFSIGLKSGLYVKRQEAPLGPGRLDQAKDEGLVRIERRSEA